MVAVPFQRTHRQYNNGGALSEVPLKVTRKGLGKVQHAYSPKRPTVSEQRQIIGRRDLPIDAAANALLLAHERSRQQIHGLLATRGAHQGQLPTTCKHC